MSLSRTLILAGAVAAWSGLLHAYVWGRLVRHPMWPAPWGKVLTIGIFALAVLVPLAFLAMRFLPRPINAPLAWVVYTWLGFALYLFLLSLLADLGRALLTLFGALPEDPERRAFLARAIAGTIGALSGVVGLGGVVNVARGFEVRHVRVPLSRLPKAASGYSIVQLTDVHVGPTIGKGFVESVVREANRLAADMIVITGDLVDGTVEQLRELVEPLRGLKAKDGVYFVTGNHEYYSGAHAWIHELRRLGTRVLLNEHVVLDHDGAKLAVAGVTDYSAHHFDPSHKSDPHAAVKGAPTGAPKVLLAHQPRSASSAADAGYDLQLSGHTHGGQFWPWNLFVRLQQPFTAGLNRLGGMWIYINRGTGYWGPPMRFGVPSEITLIRLVRG